MNSFQSYVDSILKVWNDAAPAARIGILLLSTICLAALVGVGYWSAQPSYVSLISETDPDKMDRVIDALDKASISYDLSGAGGNLRVAKSDYSKARMLARGAGVAPDAAADFGLGNAFGSPADRRRVAILKQQLSLAATIEKFNVVAAADIHLSVPDKGPFERKSSMPTASVMLDLVPGGRLTDQQATSIASMVAFAVEDLEPEAVQITDKEGRNYTMADESVQHISSQIDYIAQSERKLARKAEAQLIHFLGQGNASVQVTLDLTFTNGSKKVTKYDGESKVPSEENLNTETTTSASPRPIGAAGVEGNLATRNNKAQQTSNKSETIKTSYLVPKTEETQSNTTPLRNFLSVSVLVNSEAENIKQADGTLLPEISARVKSIVQNAVGFQVDTDTISVELLPFPSVEKVEPIPLPYDWTQWNELLRNASLAIAAIVAFLIGFLVLGKIKPAAPAAEPMVRLDEVRSKSVDQLGELVKNNPEIFAQIIENWSDAGDAPSSDGQQSQRRAA